MTERRGARRAVAVALLLGAVTALSACTGSGGPAGPTGPTGSGGSSSVPATKSSDLVAKAALARCPTVPGGPPPAKGLALPIVDLDCLGAGPTVAMGGLRGPYVVTLWASWCEPCVKEAPLFQRLHASRDVPVLGVDTRDAPGPALQFAADHELHFPSVSDPSGRVLRTAQAGSGLPVTLFVDEAGAVTYRRLGAYATYAELQRDVRKHLGKPRG